MAEYMIDGAFDTMLEVAPEDDGELKRGLRVEKLGERDYQIVGDAPHTEHVLEGTGEPVGHGRIKPRRAKALKFEWKGQMTVWKGDLESNQEKFLFARWAEERGMVPYLVWPRGNEPQNFAADAVEIEERRLDGYASEAAAVTRAEFGRR